MTDDRSPYERDTYAPGTTPTTPGTPSAWHWIGGQIQLGHTGDTYPGGPSQMDVIADCVACQGNNQERRSPLNREHRAYAGSYVSITGEHVAYVWTVSPGEIWEAGSAITTSRHDMPTLAAARDKARLHNMLGEEGSDGA